MTRTRRRFNYAYSRVPDTSPKVLFEKEYEYFVEDSFHTGGNYCFHGRSDLIPDFYILQRNGTKNQLGDFSCRGIRPNDSTVAALRQFLTSQLTAVGWDTLPSSTDFGLLQFLAELDDTLLLFSKRFWASLTYGSFTWGVLPFVSDLKAILETVAELSHYLNSLQYEDDINIAVDLPVDIYPPEYHFLIYKGDARVRKSGTLHFGNMSKQALFWLDAIGFHPDLATVWDLVPLSFVVDWLLPVGDFLSSLHQRGWVKSVAFKGWVTWKFTGTFSERISSSHPAASPQTLFSGVKVDYFERWFVDGVMPVYTSSDEIDFDLPTIKELFNIFYIFYLGRKTDL